MSKVLLKKKLASMPKAEIIGLVAELYEAKKEAKEYLDYWMNPDEDAKLEEYMKIVRYEFYPPEIVSQRQGSAYARKPSQIIRN